MAKGDFNEPFYYVVTDGSNTSLVTPNGALQIQHVGDTATSVNIVSQLVGVEVRQVSGFSNSIEIASQQIVLDVRQVSGSNYSVELASQPITLDVRQVSGNTDSVNVTNSSIPVTSLGVGTESGLGVLRIQHVADLAMSVNVIGITSTVGTNTLNSDGATIDPRDRNWSITETLGTKQVSGGIDSIEIASVPITLDVKQVSGANWSVDVASQSSTFDVRQVSGATDSINVLQLNGTIIATDQGVTGAGVLRVVHVTDVGTSVNVTNTPTVTANAGTGTFSENVAQVNGLSTFGNGVDGLGVLRVVHATDFGTSVRVNATDVALDIKQVSGSIDSIEIASQPFTLDVRQVSGNTDSINVLQLNGNLVSVGNGEASPGTLRIIHAADIGTTVQAAGDIASGTTDSGKPVKIGGKATTIGTNPTAVADTQRVDAWFDVEGAQMIRVGERVSYRAVYKAATPVGSATAPFFVIQGSATKTLRIDLVKYSATAATGIAGDLWMAKFTAISGGTKGTAPAIAKADSNDGAASGVVSVYTAVPTTATLADGYYDALRYETVTAAVSVNPGIAIFDPGQDNARPLVLRGTGQFLGIGISAAGTTPVCDLMVEWTEV